MLLVQFRMVHRERRAGGGGEKPAAGYGTLLAAGTLVLKWLDYQRLARMHSSDIVLFLVAAGFLGLEIWLGVRVFAAPGAGAL